MDPFPENSVVHLELHTGQLGAACSFYERLLGWRPERVKTLHGSYFALDLGRVGGGVVECPTEHSLWLPYVEVTDVHRATERAEGLGASVLLAPREGPVGWRSVIATEAGGEIAFWQPKRCSCG